MFLASSLIPTSNANSMSIIIQTSFLISKWAKLLYKVITNYSRIWLVSLIWIKPKTKNFCSWRKKNSLLTATKNIWFLMNTYLAGSLERSRFTARTGQKRIELKSFIWNCIKICKSFSSFAGYEPLPPMHPIPDLLPERYHHQRTLASKSKSAWEGFIAIQHDLI